MQFEIFGPFWAIFSHFGLFGHGSHAPTGIFSYTFNTLQLQGNDDMYQFSATKWHFWLPFFRKMPKCTILKVFGLFLEIETSKSNLDGIAPTYQSKFSW